MIKNTLFDFGSVFIHINKEVTQYELNILNIAPISEEMELINVLNEYGLITTLFNSKQALF